MEWFLRQHHESGQAVPLFHSCRRSRPLQRLLIQRRLYFTFSASFSLARRCQGGAEGASLCLCSVPGLSSPAGWQQRDSHRSCPSSATRNRSSRISTGFSPYLIFSLPLGIQERHSSVFTLLSVRARVAVSDFPGQPVGRGHVPAEGDTAATTRTWPGKGKETEPERFLSKFLLGCINSN